MTSTALVFILHQLRLCILLCILYVLLKMCLLMISWLHKLGGTFWDQEVRELVGSPVTPEGLGQQQGSQCQRANNKNYVKAALLGRKTEKGSVQRSAYMFTGSVV